MGRADILTEAQDLLLDLGDVAFLSGALSEVERMLLQRLPVLTEIRLVATTWAFGQWTNSTTTYTDATVSIQAGGPQALTTLTTNDGHLLGAKGFFEEVRYTVSVAAVGGTPVLEYTYWNGATWRTLTPVSPPTFTATGVQTLIFAAPDDWRQGTPTGVTFPANFDADQCWVRVRFTTAPTVTAPVITALVILTALYPLSNEVLQLLAVVYYPQELEPVPVQNALDLWNQSWPTLTGVPAYVSQQMDALHRVRLVPRPTAVGPIGPALSSGIPLPTDNTLVVMTVEVPTCDDTPQWWDGIASYLVAAADAQRLTEAQDLALAGVLGELSDDLIGMLRGVWEAQGMESTPPRFPMLRR